MSVAQKDYKKMLVYVGISQSGFIMAAILSAAPFAMAAAVFHLVSFCVYKTVLFFTAGNIESQTGTTELQYMGGMARKMPFTFMCFVLGASAAVGLIPFGAFFSSGMIYGCFININAAFFAAAWLSAIFTAAAVFGWGKLIFAGHLNKRFKDIEEVSNSVAVVTIFTAFLALMGGMFKSVVLDVFVWPSFGWGGAHISWLLGGALLFVIALVFINAQKGYALGKNYLGVFRRAANFLALEKIAQSYYADPYNLAARSVKAFSSACFKLDKALNRAYDTVFLRSVMVAAVFVRRVHGGSFSAYLAWVVSAIVIIFVFFA